MRKLNGWLTIFWIVMLPIAIFTGLIFSVPFISIVSIYALVTGHWSAWQAARVEVKQDAGDAEEKINAIHEKVTAE